MAGSNRDRFLFKAAVLLHDPPHKAWVVLGRRILSAGKACNKKSHECEAEEFARLVLEGTPLGGALNLLSAKDISDADTLAASQDRLQPEEVWKGGSAQGGGKPWGFKGLLNIFNPSLEYTSGDPTRGEVESVAKALNALLRNAESPGEAYHILYAALEPLWSLLTRNKVGPADTRVPHHSVFDHLYAAATMANWVAGGGEYRGYVVLLDLAGIQGFIAPARRLSDYWAGSWLVSLAAWYIVSEVVELYGPDVLVMPTARLNPFYYWYVEKKLLGNCPKEAGKLCSFISTLLPEGWPLQPVMPGTVTLALPHVDPPRGGSWEEYFKERYREFWRKAVEAAQEVWREALGDSVAGLLDLVKEEPPLSLRVGVEEVSFSKKEAEEKLVFYRAIKRAKKKAGGELRLAIGAGVDWGSVTRVDGGGGESKIYRVCSMCRSLPGLVRRTFEGFQYWESGRGYVNADEEQVKQDRAMILLKEGEALCPYCMVKRAFSRYSAVRRLLASVFGLSEGGLEEVFLVFPSTGDVAALSFKLGLLRSLVEKRKEAQSILDEIGEKLGEAAKKEGENGRRVYGEAYEEWQRRLKEAVEDAVRLAAGKGRLTPLKPLSDKIKNLVKEGLLEPGNSALWKLVYALVVREAEPLLLGAASRIVLGVLRSHKVVEERPGIYYAILRADGDNIGRVLGGYTIWAGCIKEYYERLYGRLSSLIAKDDDRLKDAIECVKKQVIRHVEEVMEETFKEDSEAGCSKGDVDAAARGVVPPTPSYLATLSRALMASAVNDVRVVEKWGGFVVYAGGDDLAALLPVVINEEGRGAEEPAVLRAVLETRRGYWGAYGGHAGFIALSGSVVPAPMGSGRSYGVRLAHYRDPMNWEIEYAAMLLDEYAKHVTPLVQSRIKKDSLAVSYGRFSSPPGSGGVAVGEEPVALVPNWCPREPPGGPEDAYGGGLERLCKCLERISGDVWVYVEQGRLTESFLYDVEAHRLFIEEASRVLGDGSAARKLLEWVAGRNYAKAREEKEEERKEKEKVVGAVGSLAEYGFQVGLEGGRRAWAPLECLRALRFVREGVRTGE